MSDENTLAVEFVPFESLESNLSALAKQAESAKEDKILIEKNLELENPEWAKAKAVLSHANKAKDDAEKVYRNALSEYYRTTGNLPARPFASVKMVETLIPENSDKEVIKKLILRYGTDLADFEYVTLNIPALTKDILNDVNEPWQIVKSIKATLQWVNGFLS